MKAYNLTNDLNPERVTLSRRRLPILRFDKCYNGLEVVVIPAQTLKELRDKIEIARESLNIFNQPI